MVRSLTAVACAITVALVCPAKAARAEDAPPAAQNIVDAEELDAAVRAEIAEPVVVRATQEGQLVKLTVARGGDLRSRTLSLEDVPTSRRARVLALAAADLLRDMPTLPPVAPAVVAPPPPQAKPIPAPASAPARGLDLEGQLGGFVRVVPSGSTFLGVTGKFAVCMRVFCPYAALAVGLSSTQTNIGSVSATLFRGASGLDLAFRPTPWLLLMTGPSIHVGTFGASAIARPGARASSFTAASLDAKWSGGVAFRAGYRVWLYLDLGAGMTAFGGTALVDSRAQASDRGFFVDGSLGVRFAADHAAP